MCRHLRAGEVKLEHVGTGRGGAACQLGPVSLGRTHNGGNQHLVRELLLEARHVSHGILEGALRGLLHVLEADEIRALLLEGIEARRHLIDNKGGRGYRFEVDAAPACLIGLAAHLIAVAYRRRSQAERIVEVDSQKVDGKILHSHQRSPPRYASIAATACLAQRTALTTVLSPETISPATKT